MIGYIKTRFGRYSAFFPLTIAIATVPLLLPGAYFWGVMSLIGIYTLLSVGMCLMIGYSGQFSLATPAFFGTGAYLSAILTVHYSWSPLWALIVAAMATGLLAYGMGLPLFRLRGYYFACSTFCILIICQNCMTELRNITGGAQGIHGIPYFSVGTLVFSGYLINYYFIWAVVLLFLVFSLNLVNSRSGRAMQAISTSEVAATTSGVNVAKYKVFVFTFTAVMASISGSIYAHYLSFVGPDTFGFGLLLDLLVMIVIGGITSVWGGLIGAFVFVALGEVLRTLFSTWLNIVSGGEFIMIIWGILVVVILNFVPGGIFKGGVRISKHVMTSLGLKVSS